MKKEKKETDRYFIDHSLLLDREDSYVSLGSWDSSSLPKRERKDRYYATKDPYYWTDHVLVEWLKSGSPPPIFHFISDPDAMKWFHEHVSKEFPIKWLEKEDVDRFIADLAMVSADSPSLTLYSKKAEMVKKVLDQIFSRDIQVFQDKSEEFYYVALLSVYIGKYLSLIEVRKQIYKRLNSIMDRRNRKGFRSVWDQFGYPLAVTNRKNDVLLKALCKMIESSTQKNKHHAQLSNIVPYVLCKLNILSPESTSKCCAFKQDKRLLCSKAHCLHYRINNCRKQYMEQDPDYILNVVNRSKLSALYRNKCETFRSTTCADCKNKKHSPFKRICDKGRRRFEHFLK